MAGWFATAGAVALALAWLVPDHYLPWTYFHSEALALAAVLLWGLALACGRACLTLPRGPVAAVLGVLGLVWLQRALDILLFTGDAWIATLYLAGLALALAVGWNGAQAGSAGRREPFQLLLATLLVAAVLTAVFCIVQYLQQAALFGVFVLPSRDDLRSYGNLQQPNIAAVLLAMGVAAALARWEARRLATGTFLLAILVLTLGLVLTRSRAGLLAAVGMVAWWGLVARTTPVRLRPAWTAGWLAAVFLLAEALPWLDEQLYLGQVNAKKLLDSNGRWELWAQILAGARASPWWGYGWNGTFAAQAVGAFSMGWRGSTSFAHNAVLDMIAWFGWPIGLALSVLVAAWCLRLFARARHVLPSALAVALCLPVFLHSMVEFSFACMFFLFPVAILLGGLARVHGGAVALPLPRAGMVAGVAAAGMLGLLVAREYIPTEENFRYVQYASVRLGHTPADLERPRFHLLTQMEALLAVGFMVDGAGLADADEDMMRRAASRFPWLPLQSRYAQRLAVTGQHDRLVTELRRIRGIHGAGGLQLAVEQVRRLRPDIVLPDIPPPPRP